MCQDKRKLSLKHVPAMPKLRPTVRSLTLKSLHKPLIPASWSSE